MAQRTLELLNSLMAGHVITANEVDALLSDQVAEDQFMDYKHGDELKKSMKPGPSDTIRQYVSGFANAEGGVLIVGVDAETKIQPWHVTGAIAPGGHDLARWASDCLTDILPHFSPLPRFQVLKHQDGDVLVIAVARSLGLVPCIEGRTLSYYLRLHDKTLRVPEYLLSDLLLGRRQHPSLYFGDFRLTNVSKNTLSGLTLFAIHFIIEFTIENQSLPWAEDITVGVISWNADRPVATLPVNSNLRSYIDVQTIDTHVYGGPKQLLHDVYTFNKLPTFGIISVSINRNYYTPLRTGGEMFEYTWKAAAYILSKNSPPVWYQLSLKVDEKLVYTIPPLDQDSTPKDTLSAQEGDIECTQITTERPIVGWMDMQTYP